MLPIARFLQKFKCNLKGRDRLRVEEFWDSWASDTVRGIISGSEFVIESVATGELMYAPGNSFSFDKYKRRVFTWGTKPYALTAAIKRNGGSSQSATGKIAFSFRARQLESISMQRIGTNPRTTARTESSPMCFCGAMLWIRSTIASTTGS